MAVITTGNHPKALWPGVYAWFGASYNKHERYTDKIFEKRRSSKAYEEDVETTGFGLAAVKAESAATTYDSSAQGYVTRTTHSVYSKGYIITKEAMDDNLYKEKSMPLASALAFSMFTTRETVGANILNRAFNSAYVGGNGVELISTAQPTLDGTQSNHIATASDLSEASLEALLIQIRNTKDSRGLPINIKGDALIVPAELEFEANRILFSTLQAGTGNNDVNAMRSMGLLPKGIISSPYLTDPNAWFVKTNVPNGLVCYQRNPLAFTRDNDFDTGNAKAKAVERYSFNWLEWRALFGSPGA